MVLNKHPHLCPTVTVTTTHPHTRLQAQAIADRLGLIPPVMEQPEYNLFERKKVANIRNERTGSRLPVWRNA